MNTFGNLDESIEKKTTELERLDTFDDIFGLDTSEAERRATLMSEILQESSWREAQLFQKASIKWAIEGDLKLDSFTNG